MSRQRILAIVGITAAFTLFGCSGKSTPGPGNDVRPSSEPPRVSGAEAKQLVAAGAVLLDVRTKEEFDGGHLEGARNLPVDRVADELGTLPRDRPIVVYCVAGVRAARAARTLKAAGFDARNLGSMSAWK